MTEGKWINSNLYKALISIIPLLFILQALRGLKVWGMYSSWLIGGWLINYHDGFVRRGISGFIVFGISRLTHISPIIISAVIIGSIFTTWGGLLIKECYRSLDGITYTLVCISPLLFSFGMGDAGLRKEILFFLLLIALVLVPPERNSRFIAISLTFPILILFHEAVFAWLPAIIGLAIIRRISSREYYAFLALTSFIVFALCLIFKGTTATSEAIQSYVISHGINKIYCTGAISAMGKTVSSNHSVEHFRSWVSGLVLVIILYVIPFSTLMMIKLNNSHKVIIITSLLSCFMLSAPLYYVAIDWGRWIRIEFVTALSMALYILKTNVGIKDKNCGFAGYRSLLVSQLVAISLFASIGNSGGNLLLVGKSVFFNDGYKIESLLLKT